MTTNAGILLLSQILPLIQAAIAKGAVKPVGAEDPEELAAEGVTLAARSLDAAEQAGKVVAPNSVAFYALQSLKSGRRSGYAGRTDVMCPAAQLDRTVMVSSMDERLGEDDGGLEITLHDYLAGSAEDPAGAAGRDLDWGLAMEHLDKRERYIVRETAIETAGAVIARRLRISTPRVVQIKRGIAEKIRGVWGNDALVDAVRESRWQRHVRTMTERRACRAERRAA